MDNQDGFFDKLSQYISNLKKFLDDKFWDSSFLLKRRRKEIRHTLEQVEGAKEDVQEQIKNIGREDIVAKQAVLKEIPDGTMVVYILLNIMNGRDITAWEHALSALPSCSFGRPIYMEEEHVRRAITGKGDSLNSGYVAIYVNPDYIIKEEGECDALGQEIIGLKPEAINSEHIIRFVHYNQEVFLFLNKKLIADTSSSAAGESHASGSPVSVIGQDTERDGQDNPEAPAEAVDSEGGADVQASDEDGRDPDLSDASSVDQGTQTAVEGDSEDRLEASVEAVDNEGSFGVDMQASDEDGREPDLSDASSVDQGTQAAVEGDSEDRLEASAEAVDSEGGADVQASDEDGGEAVLKSNDIEAAKEEGSPKIGKKSDKAKKEKTEPSAGQKSKKAKEEGKRK